MGANRRALVVDDEGLMRRLIRTVLEADDYEVIEAGDADEALARAQEHQPAVCVLDVMMPGVDGIAVCRLLDREQTKVVMLTARDDPEVEKQARDAGASAYLTKPFSPIELLDVLDELVSAK